MLLAFLNVSSGCVSGSELHHAAFLEEVFSETACDIVSQVRGGNLETQSAFVKIGFVQLGGFVWPLGFHSEAKGSWQMWEEKAPRRPVWLVLQNHVQQLCGE